MNCQSVNTTWAGPPRDSVQESPARDSFDGVVPAHDSIRGAGRQLVQPLLGVALTSLCLLATAIILEGADILRHISVVDDAPLPSLAGFLHPAVLLLLVLGYGVSVGMLVHGIRAERARKNRGE